MIANFARKIAHDVIMAANVHYFLEEVEKAARNGEFYVDVEKHPDNLQIGKLKRLGYIIECGKYGKTRILWTEPTIDVV